jgi:DNA (cytosine-5)-methyltransferase 1
MEEIRKIPWNGYNVISTFAGCGGSSLGYRMAGFRVLWANEFIPAAQETYLANCEPHTYLDPRDIREIQPEEILAQIKLARGELDILDGSPPCDSFSECGPREAGWGKVKNRRGVKQRTDDLFFEYIRLVKGVQPKVFVAENVSGLVKGKATGYFLDIFQSMKDCNYRVRCKLLDASWLGVPQARQRIIFIGVRDDLGKDPIFPKPLPYQYTIRDAFTELVNNHVPSEISIEKYAIYKEWQQLKPGQQSKRYYNLRRAHFDKPCFTILAEGGNIGAAGVTHPSEPRKFSIPELKRICSFPDDFILTGSFTQQWERLGNCVPPVMMYYIADTIRREILDNTKEQLGRY